MMNKSPSTYYPQILKVLLELYKKHPTYSMGKHVSTALADYGDSWGISDKEFLFALQKYKAELEYCAVDDVDVDKIIEEGKNLSTLFQEEENDDL